jgi:hypothetical protein
MHHPLRDRRSRRRCDAEMITVAEVENIVHAIGVAVAGTRV